MKWRIQGRGIAHEDVHKIFQDGFSTKNGVHRGIGLALVEQALVDLGGHIYLEKSELGGACFTVSIPKRR